MNNYGSYARLNTKLSTMTDAELNQNIKPQPYDRLVKATLLWMFPKQSGIRPNHLTMVRFLASPLVFWLLWQQYYVTGLIVFILVALTDAMDGSMARTRRQITVWGTTYDGIADKFLIGGVVLIVMLKHLDSWLAGTLLFVEGVSLLGAFYWKFKKGVVHEALWSGKIKMNLEVLATALLLLGVIGQQSLLLELANWTFGAAILLALVNIVMHIRLESRRI